MLKKTIKYTDFNGNEREEDFYFNLSQAELTEMALSENGGLDELIKKIISEQDTAKLMEMFKTIILKSYGEKDLDGKHFRKSEQISKDFESTEAYNVLFMELFTSPEVATSFIEGVLPGDVDTQAAKEKAEELTGRLPGIVQNA